MKLKALALSAIVPATMYAAPKPNVVIIIVDDLGWADLSYNGLSDYFETPNIDKLIGEGTYFSNGYASAANSAPSRACLMSGMYTPRHGVYTVNPADRGEKSARKFIAAPNNTDVSASFFTMAEMFNKEGYQCAQIGKWHLGADKDGTGPLSQGFHHNIAGERAGTPYSYFYPYKHKHRNNGIAHIGLDEGKAGEYLTDRLTDEAIKFINTNKDKPFFLYLAHHGVHTPIQAPQQIVEKYKAKPQGKHHNDPVYAAMVETVDTSVGRVCQTLDSLGIKDNTIIIFTSDNGGLAPYTSNAPLRDGKGSPYEGGSRVPIAIKWSGKNKMGKRVDTPVIGLDIYPTLANAIGAKPPKGLDGEDVTKLAKESKRDRPIFWHFPAYLEGKGSSFRARPYSTVRMGDWKLIYHYEDEKCELFNLKDDISESRNMAETNPQKRDELYKELQRWLESTNAPTQFNPNPAYSGTK